MLPSISGYDGWKTASPYDDDAEWEEEVSDVGCGADNDCEWAGDIQASCVGNEDNYTYYWTCPECGSDNEGQVM
jgi:hypothetical protein